MNYITWLGLCAILVLTGGELWGCFIGFPNTYETYIWPPLLLLSHLWMRENIPLRAPKETIKRPRHHDEEQKHSHHVRAGSARLGSAHLRWNAGVFITGRVGGCQYIGFWHRHNTGPAKYALGTLYEYKNLSIFTFTFYKIRRRFHIQMMVEKEHISEYFTSVLALKTFR